MDPLSAPKRPEEHQVGCDDKHEGEYFASQISGGSDVIVTWLKFTVDGQPYHCRSFYPFQGAATPAIDKAVRLTIEGVSPRIVLN